MQGSDAGKLRDPRVPRIHPVAALGCWAAGTLVFALLPQGSEAKTVIATVFSLSAAAFAAVALLGAAPRAEGHERAFLRLMGLGMACRLVGNSLWSASHLFGFGIVTPVAPQDIAYAISYPLLVGAMLHLVALATRRITLVSAIDAGAVMLSVGTLAWYFLLSLQYMRRRAGEVGADLAVISAGGRGTTVQVRFRKRQSTPTRRRAIRQAPRVRAECSL